MKISAVGRTDRGRRRSRNEDDLALVDLSAAETVDTYRVEHRPVAERGILLAVCDGVGGHRAGDIAAALALETLANEMERLVDGCPQPELFRKAIEDVNRRVWTESKAEERLRGMATTLTAALLCHGRAIVAHVGDSRAYMLRNGHIRQITRDQSFVQAMVAAGAIDEAQAARSPFRNVILQAIGQKGEVEVAIDAVDLAPGDGLLLCTDGLSEKVRPDEMARLLGARSLPEAVDALVDLANERGGEDNITALAARVEEEAA